MRFYLEIFEHILPNITALIQPGIPYWPASPSSGGNFKAHWSTRKGDTHFWAIWKRGGKEKIRDYAKHNSRFVSEFGHFAFPNLETLKQWIPSDHLNVNSPIFKIHDKQTNGILILADKITQQFGVDFLRLSIEKQVYLSQLSQLDALGYAIAHWRLNSKIFRTMGALYWQLNDCWPVISWSSIDVYGRWKGFHYEVKRLYQPIAIIFEEKRTGFEVWLINDTLHEANIKIEYTLWGISPKAETVQLKASKILCKSKAMESKSIETITINQNKKLKIPKENVFLIFRYEYIDPVSKTIQKVNGTKIYGLPKAMIELLPEPEIEFNIKEAESQTQSENENEIKLIWIDLKAKRPALYVSIEIPDIILDGKRYGFRFSDNYFSMDPHREYRIEMEMREIVTKIDFQRDQTEGVGSSADIPIERCIFHIKNSIVIRTLKISV